MAALVVGVAVPRPAGAEVAMWYADSARTRRREADAARQTAAEETFAADAARQNAVREKAEADVARGAAVREKTEADVARTTFGARRSP